MLLFVSQIGYHFIYIIQQNEAKEEAERELLAKLPESSLELIDLAANKNDIDWEEEGKEFYLHGQMYDVAKTKDIEGKTILYCLNDKKEELVLQDLSKAVRSGNDQNADNKNGQHTIKFQLTDLFAFTENTAIIIQPASQEHIGFKVSIVSTIKEIITPPPNTVNYV